MNEPDPHAARGRGTGDNPRNRFRTIHTAMDAADLEYSRRPADLDPAVEDAFDEPSAQTVFYEDDSRSILSENDSPDVPFSKSINPYRGCEHGCTYCYARPSHEYLGLSAGLDFETKIFVKRRAPELLEEELSHPRYAPAVLGISGVTDAYQPVERKLQITRRCIEVCARFRNPVMIITKSDLVTRDIDLLQELHRHRACGVCISIPTLQLDLTRHLEPRACTPRRRLAAIETLAAAGIPVGVLVAPLVPGLTDHEMGDIFHAARAAGATFAGFVMLRLPHGLRELFTNWLDVHQPLAKEKILSRLRLMHGGKLYESKPGVRMRGEGPYAEQMAQLFRVLRSRAGLGDRMVSLETRHFQRPARPASGPYQPGLFDNM